MPAPFSVLIESVLALGDQRASGAGQFTQTGCTGLALPSKKTQGRFLGIVPGCDKASGVARLMGAELAWSRKWQRLRRVFEVTKLTGVWLEPFDLFFCVSYWKESRRSGMNEFSGMTPVNLVRRKKPP